MTFIELRTDGITDETAKKFVDIYLRTGDLIVDTAAEKAKEFPTFFTTKK